MTTSVRILGLASGLALTVLASPPNYGLRSVNVTYKDWAPHASPCWSDNLNGIRSLEWPSTQYLNPDSMTVETCLDEVNINPYLHSVSHILRLSLKKQMLT